MLKYAKDALITVATLKVQLEQQADEIFHRIDALEVQSVQAISRGAEDIRLLAHKRKQTFITGLDALNRDLASVTELEHQLARLVRELTRRCDHLHLQRNAMIARLGVQPITTYADLLEVQLEVRSIDDSGFDIKREGNSIEDHIQLVKARLSVSQPNTSSGGIYDKGRKAE